VGFGRQVGSVVGIFSGAGLWFSALYWLIFSMPQAFFF
jgi:hypothetical protein